MPHNKNAIIMNKSKILVGFIAVCCLLYTVFQFNGEDFLCRFSKSLIIPSITLLYFTNFQKRSAFFVAFLVLYSISELIIFPVFSSELYYFVGNYLYIFAYIFLIYEIVKSMDLKYVLRHYALHLMVLLGFSVYVVYVLMDVASGAEKLLIMETITEFVYNLVILFLLSVSLINSLYRDSKRALLILFGSICIVFSEVIQIGYFYIAERNLLGFLATVFLTSAFVFYYVSQTKTEEKDSSRILAET